MPMFESFGRATHTNSLTRLHTHTRLAYPNPTCGKPTSRHHQELAAIPAGNRRDHDVGNCGKLSAAEHPYFDGGLVKMTKPGR